MMGVREAAKNSGSGVSTEDVISRVLCLGGGVNQELAIIAKFFE